jgi:hypothetical protein
MRHTVLVDYELAVAQQGFIVRALLATVASTAWCCSETVSPTSALSIPRSC